jgi:hypothetical protein
VVKNHPSTSIAKAIRHHIVHRLSAYGAGSGSGFGLNSALGRIGTKGLLVGTKPISDLESFCSKNDEFKRRQVRLGVVGRRGAGIGVAGLRSARVGAGMCIKSRIGLAEPTDWRSAFNFSGLATGRDASSPCRWARGCMRASARASGNNGASSALPAIRSAGRCGTRRGTGCRYKPADGESLRHEPPCPPPAGPGQRQSNRIGLELFDVVTCSRLPSRNPAAYRRRVLFPAFDDKLTPFGSPPTARGISSGRRRPSS